MLHNNKYQTIIYNMTAARKKVIRKKGKRYYRAGRSGLVRLKGKKKPPFKKGRKPKRRKR